MTAGVPGLGLGGLFALLAALCLPMLRSRRGSAARLVGMALVIVVAAIAAWQVVAWLYTVVSSPDERSSVTGAEIGGAHGLSHPAIGQLFGVPIIVISVGLMLAMLAGGEALYRILGVRPTPTPPPIPAPRPPAVRTTRTPAEGSLSDVPSTARVGTSD
jgi:hypothetical protein